MFNPCDNLQKLLQLSLIFSIKISLINRKEPDPQFIVSAPRLRLRNTAFDNTITSKNHSGA
jgi:hypothetical protein